MISSKELFRLIEDDQKYDQKSSADEICRRYAGRFKIDFTKVRSSMRRLYYTGYIGHEDGREHLNWSMPVIVLGSVDDQQ